MGMGRGGGGIDRETWNIFCVVVCKCYLERSYALDERDKRAHTRDGCK